MHKKTFLGVSDVCGLPMNSASLVRLASSFRMMVTPRPLAPLRHGQLAELPMERIRMVSLSPGIGAQPVGTSGLPQCRLLIYQGYVSFLD